MIYDMFPWMGGLVRNTLLALAAGAGLVVLYFVVRFVRFMRTAR